MKVNPTGKIEYDLGANRLTMRDIHTQDLIIDEMDIHIEKGTEIIEKLFSAEALVKGNGKTTLARLYDFQKAPKEIESFRIRVPEDTASRALVAAREDSLAKEGISSIAVSFEEGQEMSITGKVHRIVDIPFRISGRLSPAPDHKVRYSVERMDLLGLIPLPHILRALVLAMTDVSGFDKGLQRDGDSFTLDPGSFMPERTQVPLDAVETRKGFLVLAGEGKKGIESPA